MRLLGALLDERFFEYRRRSTSMAGITMVVIAIALFDYRYFHDHVWNWDLFTVCVDFVVVKFVMMGWFYARS